MAGSHCIRPRRGGSAAFAVAKGKFMHKNERSRPFLPCVSGRFSAAQATQGTNRQSAGI
jgi:hypothetical protein